MTKKKLVYTAVIGNPDALYGPTLPLPDWEKICYTDLVAQRPVGYETRQVKALGRPPRQSHRFYKILRPMLLSGYTYSLWVTSTYQLKVDPTSLLEYLGPDSDILLFKHPQRDCLYQEAKVCQRYFNPEPIVRQVAKYRAEGYPEHNGLYATAVMLRRHSPLMTEMAWAWRREVWEFSHRDQIGLPYVIWKLGVKVSTFPSGEQLASNSFFNVFHHNYENNPFQDV